jgi:hypothetical protein
MSIRITYDDKYEVGNGMPYWLRSHEEGLTVGDVRFLAGRLMWVSAVQRAAFRKTEVWWSPVDAAVGIDEWRTTLKTNADTRSLIVHVPQSP